MKLEKRKVPYFKRVLKSIYQTNIYWLVFTPFVVAFFMLYILNKIGERLYQGTPPDAYYYLLLVIFLITSSMSGIFQIIKREGIGRFGAVSQGVWPVIEGVALVLVCWIVSLYFLIQFFIVSAS